MQSRAINQATDQIVGQCPVSRAPPLSCKKIHLLVSPSVHLAAAISKSRHRCSTVLAGRQPSQPGPLDSLNTVASASNDGRIEMSFPRTAHPGALQSGHQLKNGAYTVTDVLGSGSNAITYKAVARDSGREVAIKALSLRGLRDWKQLTMFEREAQVLASLSHPSIPAYLDYFEDNLEQDMRFFLVQEVAQGKSLAAMVDQGMRCSSAEALRIATELLNVLSYLSDLKPAVIHRDVKPENIVIEGGQWGGRVYLVDFGGVQGVAAVESSGLASTIVGTYGYMAPEQFRGAAQPASDLYALGATLLFLLTGQPPSAFEQERMRIKWRPALPSPGDPWDDLLDGLLEPLAEDRLTAAEALALAQGKSWRSPQSNGSGTNARQRGRLGGRLGGSRSGVADYGNGGSTSGRGWGTQAGEETNEDALLLRRRFGARSGADAGRIIWGQSATRALAKVGKPANSIVQLEKSRTRLDVTIPPRGLTSDTVATGIFALAWNAFVAFWTVGAFAGGGFLFALFSAPFWFAGTQLIRTAVSGALTRERFAVGRNKFRLGQQLALAKDGKADFLEGSNEKVVEGNTRDVKGARLVTVAVLNGVPQTAIEIVEGNNMHRFGAGLSLGEQAWLVQEINDSLEVLLGHQVNQSALPPPAAPEVRDDIDSSFDTPLDPLDPWNDRRFR